MRNISEIIHIVIETEIKQESIIKNLIFINESKQIQAFSEKRIAKIIFQKATQLSPNQLLDTLKYSNTIQTNPKKADTKEYYGISKRTGIQKIVRRNTKKMST